MKALSPHDRHTWRSGVRSAMSAASQLPGRVVKIVGRYVNGQDISSIGVLIPCARGFVSPATPCLFGTMIRVRGFVGWLSLLICKCYETDFSFGTAKETYTPTIK